MFLVWRIGTRGIPQLGLKKRLVLLVKSMNTLPKCPLNIGVNIHLDDTITNGFTYGFRFRTRPSMKHKIDRVLLRFEFLLNIILGILKYSRLKLHIAGFINTVNIAERGGDYKMIAYLHQLFISISNFFGLGIQPCAFNSRIVNTVFFPTRHPKFNLQVHVQSG